MIARYHTFSIEEIPHPEDDFPREGCGIQGEEPLGYVHNGGYALILLYLKAESRGRSTTGRKPQSESKDVSRVQLHLVRKASKLTKCLKIFLSSFLRRISNTPASIFSCERPGV